MRIYFSGSISGGREYVEMYREIGKILSDLNHEILTEHILDTNLTNCGEDRNAQEIFERDVEMLRESEVIIAEITTPSHGVGYEIALGVEWGKPILCLINADRKNKRISAMIEGNAPDKLTLEEYTLENLREIIVEFLNKIN